MDFQFWIYVIAVIAMILARALKKAPKREESNRPGDTPDSPNRPISFEDLLREIQQSKTPPISQPEPRPRPTPTLKTTPPARSYDVDYDEDLEEEEQDLETIPIRRHRDEQTNEIYENAKRLAFQRQSLEETMKLADTDVKFSHFKGYEDTQKASVASDVLRDFRDPEGFKKAFIMSEILKRKF